MASREERRGRNEALFREVNERIVDVADRFEADHLVIVCECANLRCAETIELSRATYNDARKDPVTFIVFRDHVDPSIEEAVVHLGEYVFVRKFGDAAEAAMSNDPR